MTECDQSGDEQERRRLAIKAIASRGARSGQAAWFSLGAATRSSIPA